MQVPRYWREQGSRYGNGEGGLRGSRCPVCGELSFPSRAATVCAKCRWLQDKEGVEIRGALGVGTLLLAVEDNNLKLLLFRQIFDGQSDKDSQKLERIANREQLTALAETAPSSATSKPRTDSDQFSRAQGLNTVTGKVETLQQSVSADDPHFVTFVEQLLGELQREVEEEAGVTLPAENFRLLTESPLLIEQYRGEQNQQQQKILYRFVIYAFAALLSRADLDQVRASGREVLLFDVQNLATELRGQEVRKATQAILSFLSTALLFIGEQAKIPEVTTDQPLSQHYEKEDNHSN